MDNIRAPDLLKTEAMNQLCDVILSKLEDRLKGHLTLNQGVITR